MWFYFEGVNLTSGTVGWLYQNTHKHRYDCWYLSLYSISSLYAGAVQVMQIMIVLQVRAGHHHIILAVFLSYQGLLLVHK